jgi:hypothetical protein
MELAEWNPAIKVEASERLIARPVYIFQSVLGFML